MMSPSPATPVQHTARRGGRDPRSVELNPRGHGSFGALSSDGVNIYTVRASPASCTCLGWQHYGHCCLLPCHRSATGPDVPLV
jgi:SWIM zinc finger